MGTEIKDATKVPDPPAPAGAPRVRFRGSRGSSPAPMGSNYHDLLLPDGKIVTKASKEHRTGHMHMLSHLVQGPPWNQHRELQMARGAFKSVQYSVGTRVVAKVVSKVLRAYSGTGTTMIWPSRLRFAMSGSGSTRDYIRTALHSRPRFYMRLARSLQRSSMLPSMLTLATRKG